MIVNGSNWYSSVTWVQGWGAGVLQHIAPEVSSSGYNVLGMRKYFSILRRMFWEEIISKIVFKQRHEGHEGEI